MIRSWAKSVENGGPAQGPATVGTDGLSEARAAAPPAFTRWARVRTRRAGCVDAQSGSAAYVAVEPVGEDVG